MTPTTSGLHLDEVTLPTGVRLHYAHAGASGGAPVLFLHGITDSWYSFARVLPRLPDTVRAFAPSLRGHGDSERPPAGYTPAGFAADAVAFLDAVGVERATVVGHSMGSVVAQRVAAAYPERVARLVLVGSCVSAVNEGMLALNEAVQALADPVPDAFAREFQLSTIYRTLPAPFVDAVVAESRKVPARVWRAALAALLADTGAPGLARVQAPTLLLWGDRDAVFAREQQHELAALIPGADLRVYPETGHALHWEQPARFVEDLLVFVRAMPERMPAA